MPSLELTVPPASEPLTLAEAKLHARIDGDADDTLVSCLIAAARQWAEGYTGRAFLTQTWRMWRDAWPAARSEGVAFVTLARPPLISVASVQLFDEADAATVWPASSYFVDTAREPGRLALRSGAGWPSVSRAANGIMIEYAAGYGSDPELVPGPIKTAILQLVAHWYEHRGEAGGMAGEARGLAGAFNAVNVPMVIQALLDPYRVRGLGG